MIELFRVTQLKVIRFCEYSRKMKATSDGCTPDLKGIRNNKINSFNLDS